MKLESTYNTAQAMHGLTCMDRKHRRNGPLKQAGVGGERLRLNAPNVMFPQLTALSLPCFSAWLNRRPTGPRASCSRETIP